MTVRFLKRAWLLVAVAAVALVIAVPLADAAVLHCGDTVTHSLTLGNDLTCDVDNVDAITVGADHIAVDLGGHTIRWTGILGEGFAGAGVNFGGHSHVTVQNGTIIDFEPSVDLNGTDNIVRRIQTFGRYRQQRGFFSASVAVSGARNRVVESNLTGYFTGVFVVGDDHVIAGSRMGALGPQDDEQFLEDVGVLASDSGVDRLTVQDSKIINARFFGVELHRAVDTTLIRNTIIAGGSQGKGAVWDEAGQGSRFISNFVGGGAAGFFLEGVAGAQLRANRATVGGSGFVTVLGSGMVLAGNHAYRTGESGFVIDGSDGAVLQDNIAGNPTPLFTGENNGNGIHGFAIIGGASDTHLLRNAANKNGGDGVLVDAGTSLTDVRSTIAARNGQNGIEVNSSSATLTANRASFNGGWGILAQLGVIGGGGNIAYGNAAGQCTNVSC
jgi:parallel beta helix pectate lyase-like protein